MNLNLRDKQCVLTGCFGGLGQAIGRALVAEGARLIATGRQNDTEGQAKALDVFGPGVVYRRLEATEPASVESLFADLVPDVAIANAAVTHSHPFLELPSEEWRRVLDINLTGSFLFAQAAARKMKARGSGNIVLISSWVQDFPLAGTVAYTVSKSGLKMLMKNMALELAPFGIRVNLVSPGNFNAGMAQRQMEREPARRANAEARVALGRFGEAYELADAVLFMASERASYITGTTLLVDGGNSLGKRA
jgi:NAD(P)-dependent dehydrogenase (short-subunit alcohol dehydrogenase family)